MCLADSLLPQIKEIEKQICDRESASNLERLQELQRKVDEYENFDEGYTPSHMSNFVNALLASKKSSK